MKLTAISIASLALTLPAFAQTMQPVTITSPALTGGLMSERAITVEVEPEGDQALQLVHIKCAVYADGLIVASGQGNVGLIAPGKKSVAIVDLSDSPATIPAEPEKITCSGYGMSQ